MTDDATFEETEPQRCPACLATVEPGQQYCLACGERLTPDPLEPRRRSPAAAIIVIGLLLLLLGGFGIAYGFTRGDDTTTSAATTAHPTGTTAGSLSGPPTASSADVPTFTSVPSATSDQPTFSTSTAPTFSTSTGTTTTQPTTTATPAEANDWPSGTNGWAVLLMSRDTQQYDFAYITQQKTAAENKGISNAGVLNSDDFFTLNPGYWVLYMGPYTSKSAAQAALPTAVSKGYSDAYVRNVAE